MEAPHTIHVRSSSTPLLMRCAGCSHPEPGELLIDQDSDAADLGTEAHRAAAIMVETGSIPWDTLPEDKELRMLCAMATKLWRQVEESFPNAMTEVPLRYETGGVVVTGHADLLSIGGSIARVADLKTGRKDFDYSAQLKTYAALVLCEHPELTQATSTILWVRDQEIESYTMVQREAHEWLDDLASVVVDWNGVYTTGSHCQWCQRTASCPAARAMVRRSVEAFVPGNAADQLATMTPDQVISLLDTAKLVERYAKAAQQVVRDLVVATGDVVGSGHRLTLEATHPREIDPLKAFPVLESLGFGDPELAQCVDVSLSKAEDIVRKRAPRGNGAAAVRDLDAALDTAGAVTRKTSYRLVQKRV
jgi:hypothetical protein